MAIIQPFAQYKLNDNTENNIVVDSGYGQNNGLANTNTSNLATVGRINGGFELNGSSEVVFLNELAIDIALDTVGTIAFWISPTADFVNRYDLEFADNSRNGQFVIQYYPDGYIYIVLENTSNQELWYLQQNVGLYLQWNHICLVQDGISPKLYFNGSRVSETFTTTTDLTAWFSQTGIIKGSLGASTVPSVYSNKKYDDFRYYKKVLNESHISYLYNNGNGTEGWGIAKPRTQAIFFN